MKTIILDEPESETILARDADVSKGIIAYKDGVLAGYVVFYINNQLYKFFQINCSYHPYDAMVIITLISRLSEQGYTFKQLS